MGISGSSFLSQSSAQPQPIPRVPRDEDDSEEKENHVFLYVYDLANGWAGFLSSVFARFHIDYIWHTSIVVFDTEYSFGQAGITVEKPGHPKTLEFLGRTTMSKRRLHNLLDQLQKTVYDHRNYNPFETNCHTFSNHLSRILTNHEIPAEYTTLGEKIGRLIRFHYPNLGRSPLTSGSGSNRYLQN